MAAADPPREGPGSEDESEARQHHQAALDAYAEHEEQENLRKATEQAEKERHRVEILCGERPPEDSFELTPHLDAHIDDMMKKMNDSPADEAMVPYTPQVGDKRARESPDLQSGKASASGPPKRLFAPGTPDTGAQPKAAPAQPPTENNTLKLSGFPSHFDPMMLSIILRQHDGFKDVLKNVEHNVAYAYFDSLDNAKLALSHLHNLELGHGFTLVAEHYHGDERDQTDHQHTEVDDPNNRVNFLIDLLQHHPQAVDKLIELVSEQPVSKNHINYHETYGSRVNRLAQIPNMSPDQIRELSRKTAPEELLLSLGAAAQVLRGHDIAIDNLRRRSLHLLRSFDKLDAGKAHRKIILVGFPREDEDDHRERSIRDFFSYVVSEDRDIAGIDLYAGRKTQSDQVSVFLRNPTVAYRAFTELRRYWGGTTAEYNFKKFTFLPADPPMETAKKRVMKSVIFLLDNYTDIDVKQCQKFWSEPRHIADKDGNAFITIDFNDMNGHVRIDVAPPAYGAFATNYEKAWRERWSHDEATGGEASWEAYPWQQYVTKKTTLIKSWSLDYAAKGKGKSNAKGKGKSKHKSGGHPNDSWSGTSYPRDQHEDTEDDSWGSWRPDPPPPAAPANFPRTGAPPPWYGGQGGTGAQGSQPQPKGKGRGGGKRRGTRGGWQPRADHY